MERTRRRVSRQAIRHPACRPTEGRCGYLLAVVFFRAPAFFEPPALGGLPMTPFSGQILNAGHFSQPATKAIGQSVIVTSGATSAP